MIDWLVVSDQVECINRAGRRHQKQGGVRGKKKMEENQMKRERKKTYLFTWEERKSEMGLRQLHICEGEKEGQSERY